MLQCHLQCVAVRVAMYFVTFVRLQDILHKILREFVNCSELQCALQCVAVSVAVRCDVCCSALQRVAVCCNVLHCQLQRVTVCCSVLTLCTKVFEIMLVETKVSCSALQCLALSVAVCCSVLQCVAVCTNVMLAPKLFHILLVETDGTTRACLQMCVCTQVHVYCTCDFSTIILR